MSEKIVTLEEFASIREKLRRMGRKVVLCHGVFDLLHYGHIEHLQEARGFGDVLVVSVTAAAYVNKGPGRPYFTDRQRLFFLANIACVDYVILSEAVTVHKVVRTVRPDIYVKGAEYATAANDVTGNISGEQAIVEEYGGTIKFTHGAVYSSTKLINNFFGGLPENVLIFSQHLREKYGENVARQVRTMIDRFAALKVLVVGDIIIDDYVFCAVQGLTSKDAAMSARYESWERYAGGALAIARHIANFAGEVTLLSMTGHDRDVEDFLLDVMPPVKCRVVEEKNFVTPVKRRFLKRHALRKEYEKLFSVNYLLTKEGQRQVNYDKFYRNLADMLPQYDMVVVCDYGHGLLTDKAITMMERTAKFLAVNCQANSSNYGMNVITKYRRADAFVVDEKELHLAFPGSVAEDEEMLSKLEAMLNSKYAWETLGARGANCAGSCIVPAVTLHVKDTVGAGDAFYSLAALCAATDVPKDLATLISNVAGAIKTAMVGNSGPIPKVDLLKFIGTVLNV